MKRNNNTDTLMGAWKTGRVWSNTPIMLYDWDAECIPESLVCSQMGLWKVTELWRGLHKSVDLSIDKFKHALGGGA